MRTSKENDIFEDMRKIIGCTYISDLPFYGYQILHEIKRLNLSQYDTKQLEDFSVYVFGLPYEALHSMGVM